MSFWVDGLLADTDVLPEVVSFPRDAAQASKAREIILRKLGVSGRITVSWAGRLEVIQRNACLAPNIGMCCPSVLTVVLGFQTSSGL